MPPPADTTFAETSRHRRRPAVVVRVPSVESFVLYCGAVDPLAAHPLDAYDQHSAGVPQFLPSPPPHERSHETSRSTGNGCGARVHSGAVPVQRTPCWFGWADGLAPTVVPLETQYFPHELAYSLGLAEDRGWGRATCGCSSSGLGCAIW
ncbi:hypothetical protein B0H17DRAFT_296278 [Mycena rosella]|uniref:Uncharacterized protein n=1 Tax=Mycena rosella TaxID=1033263 RepID=A0AAD7DTP5_MYCRO|nr:hypothetical protein B0H17DRAFT_296278 [Mycena rosella]